MQELRVFTQIQTQRMGLQNRLLRRLREMGCKLVKASLDERLTIEVIHGQGQGEALRRLGGGVTIDRRTTNDICSVDIDGCLVKWIEPRKGEKQ